MEVLLAFVLPMQQVTSKLGHSIHCVSILVTRSVAQLALELDLY